MSTDRQTVTQLLDLLDASKDPSTQTIARKLRHAIAQLNRQLVDWTDKACTDPLTGLANRRALEQLTKTKASLLMIDLDGFKAINDTHGHVVGDQALVHVSTTFKGQLRSNDLLFRIGGDEFLVVLDADQAVAEQVARRLQGALTTSMVRSFSYGVLPVDNGWSIRPTLERLDQQLYANKRGY